MQKRIFIVLMVLMFVLSSGFVFAQPYQKLEIKSVKYDNASNNLIVNYSDSKTPSFDSGSNMIARNTVLSLSYEVNDTKDNINYFVLYIPKSLNQSEQNLLSKKISNLVYVRDVSKFGSFFTYFPPFAVLSNGFDFLRQTYDDEFPSETYNSSCYTDKENLKINLSKELNVEASKIEIKCGLTGDNLSSLEINFNDLKDDGTFIVALIKYNVIRNLGPMEYYTANLSDISETKNWSNSKIYKGTFIKNKDDLFNKNNFFAKISYLDVNNSQKVVLPIKLKSEVEESNINLKLEVGNGTIYYTLDDFNLSDYFLKAFKSIEASPSSLNSFKNVETIIPQIKKYTSPVELSSGKKLNAIAVNWNFLTISNYLQGITISNSSSGDSSSTSQTKKLSINFKDNKISDSIICEKETKICYYSNWENIDVVVNKAYSDKPVYFSINQLTKDYKDKVSKGNPGTLSGNEISLGVGNYISSAQTNFNIKNNSTDNYFLAAMQDNTNTDYLYFVYVEDLNQITEYKTYQKIINTVYCNTFDCKIPDWMPYDIITPAYENSAPIENETEPSLDKDPDCKYADDLKILCNFNIFDIENKIGSTSISSSAGTFSPKETYYLEIKSYYDDKKSTFNQNLEAYKLFESEKKNFNLTDNEIAIFFSIIGGESSFLNNQVGDQGESIGLAQINKPIWKTSQGFDNLKVYLPNSVDTLNKYYTYFDESGSDLNKSLYLGLAVFKYNLNYAKTNITEFNSRYTDIDKAFIMFYSHQFNIRDTRTFFNTVTIPSDKDNVIINCAGTGNDLFQNSSQKKLGCVATVGSVRKIGWYLFYLNK